MSESPTDTHDQHGTANDEREPAPQTAATSRGVIVLIFVWPLICIAGAGLYVKREIDAVQQALSARPPVAVIDLNAAVIKRIEADPAGGSAKAVADVYSKGAKLAKAGYIVVPRNNLVAYPAEYEVKP